MSAFIFRALKEFGSAEITGISNILTELGLSGNHGTEPVSIKTNIGLWRSCVSVPGNKMCSDGASPSMCSLVTGEAADICHKTMAARAFITIACIISGVSAICFFACALKTINQNKMAIMIGIALTISSFVAGVIGLGLGITVTTATGSLPIKASISSAAIIAIVAVVVNMLGTVLAVLTR
jgi:hypothetical protein